MSASSSVISLKFEAFVDIHEFGCSPPEPPQGKEEKCKERFLHVQLNEKKKPIAITWADTDVVPPTDGFKEKEEISLAEEGCKRLYQYEAHVSQLNKACLTTLVLAYLNRLADSSNRPLPSRRQ